MSRPRQKLGIASLVMSVLAFPAGALAQMQMLAPVPGKPTAQTATSQGAPAPQSKASQPHKKSAKKKTEPEPQVPATPQPPPTLEQQPPTAPQVSWRNGQLTIDAQNATLSQILRSVQTQTGASVEIPASAGGERVVARLGPGKPRDVLASLLNGSKFNYIILGVPGQADSVQKVILTARQNVSSGGTPTQAAQVFRPQPSQPAPPPPEEEEDMPQPDPEPDVQNGQANVDQPPPDGVNADQNAKTPEQLLQELQQMQLQRQQMQQQLNPSNQPFGAPNQPAPQPQ